MSTVPMHNLELMAPPVVKTIQRRSLLVGLIFAVVAAIGAWVRPEEFFRAYLMAFMAWLGVTLGSMAILMLRHLTKGAWGMVIRRILGAAMRCVPLMAILFVPLLFGIRRLYIWARPLDAIADKHLREHLEEITKSYLNVNGFIIRAVIYFAIWNLLSFFLTKWSAEQDRPPMRDNSARFKALSGPGLILYGFTITFAAIDWVMSIDPSWISTIFGLSFLIGEVLSALCFAVVVERILFRYKPMSELLKPEQVHDHGKFMLAFIMVWAYFSFSQWLIIWAGNLPEEITWYMRRLNGGWGYVGLFLVLFHFAVPFVSADLASLQTRHHPPGLAGSMAFVDALRRSVLDHRARFFRHLQPDLVGRGGPDCDGRTVAGVFLPQSEFDAAGSRLRRFCGGGSGAGP